MEMLKVETLSKQDSKSRILEVLWELKKKGRANATIKNVSKALNALEKFCDLDKPEQVRTFIATFDRKNGYKRNLCFAYDNYVKVHGLQWERPKYYVPSKLPKIPLESQIDCIITKASPKLALAISMSKDTGLRPIELMRLKLKDIDLAKGAVYPETAKHGSPRVLKLSNSTLNMLNKWLSKKNLGLNDNLFTWWNSDIYSKFFRETRNKVAKKMSDNSIKSIRLYDLRHYFATMTYHRTKDILFVKQQMGHRKIETTMIYTQLLQFEKDDNYTCKVAKNVEQATELIEVGFEYITGEYNDGGKIFRKRK
jgi:integrase